MEETQMHPAHAENLVANSSNALFGVQVIPVIHFCHVKFIVYVHIGRLVYIILKDCKEIYMYLPSMCSLSCFYFLFVCICKTHDLYNIAIWTTCKDIHV